MGRVLELTDRGFYCPAGDFHVDPWEPVERAVITHAHGDHARRGSAAYLTASAGVDVLRVRMGADARIQGLPYGESVRLGDAAVSLHPAGHLLGSAQVRVRTSAGTWVVSGDYKTEPDPTCTPFEPVSCDVFVTESTFGLPIYRWPAPADVFAEIHAWWRENREAGRASIVFAYALGKAQRLLAGLDADEGPILVHGAVDRLLAPYRAAGVALPPTRHASAEAARQARGRALVVAPPSAQSPGWLRKFGAFSTAFASGWMRIRGTRRRRNVDRGFVLSDHADWDGLRAAIEATGAGSIGVTHGYTEVMARWLRETGREAWIAPTRFQGESDDADAEPQDAE